MGGARNLGHLCQGHQKAWPQRFPQLPAGVHAPSTDSQKMTKFTKAVQAELGSEEAWHARVPRSSSGLDFRTASCCTLNPDRLGRQAGGRACSGHSHPGAMPPLGSSLSREG